MKIRMRISEVKSYWCRQVLRYDLTFPDGTIGIVETDIPDHAWSIALSMWKDPKWKSCRSYVALG